jgi:hypothetical protein
VDASLRQCLIAAPATRAELQTRLSISQPTVSRLVARHADEIATLGRGRATRYALRRAIRELPPDLPVYRITSAGQAQEIGHLSPVQGGYWFEDTAQPRNSELFASLPWFLADMRPQGFLGRNYSRQHPQLNLPERITDWHDDQALYALARCGDDASGNLIVGEESFALWSSSPQPAPLTDRQRLTHYPRLAEQALAGELAGSSAGGEQPKFLAVSATTKGSAHVLVKFSEPVNTPTGRRWADLLLAEHHALVAMNAAGIAAAQSRLLEAGGRLFLEVRRFDRIGVRGRRGLISLGAIDDQYVGQRRHWLDTAHALLRQRRLTPEDVERIAWLQAFGGLIGNTDMHFGNLSLLHEGPWPMQLAPAYDMLPMCYAPQRGEVRTPDFKAAAPPARGVASARKARETAQHFWMQVAQDARISAGFRKIAKANAVVVATLHW